MAGPLLERARRGDVINRERLLAGPLLERAGLDVLAIHRAPCVQGAFPLSDAGQTSRGRGE
jgi:hypothetical protein